MRVSVLYFAGYREAAGRASEQVELPSGARVGDLSSEVTRRHPSIPCAPERLVAAVNGEYSTHDHVLSSGDEVALIPPVSGGSGAPEQEP